MANGYLTLGSINSQLYKRIRSGLNFQMLGTHVSGVFAVFPDMAAKDFPGFPIMVVKPVPKISDATASGVKRLDADVYVTCYSKSVQLCNEAIDKAYQVLEDFSNKSGVDSLGLNEVKYKFGQINTGFIGDTPLHQRDLILTGWYE